MIVSNALPPGVAFVSAVSSQGACTNTSGRVTCNLGTLAAGASATVTLEVIPGAVGAITNTASVRHDGAGLNPAANTATVLTTVNPVAGLSISDATVTEVNSGTAKLLFLISLSVADAPPVAVNYATSDGTAVAGSDYLLTSGTISFPPGTTNQTVAVPVLGDLLNEPNETFQLQLVQATYATLPALAATGTIINDDPLPTLAINDVAVVEGNVGTTIAVFTVNLSAASGRNVSVAYATADATATAGADCVAKSGTLTFPAGTTNLNLAITVNGDVLTETNETFFVNLTSSSLATISDGQGVGTILDDDFRITEAVILGSDVRIRFTTVTNLSYRLEHTDNLTAPILWTPVAGGESVAGTGSVVEALH